MDRSGSERRGTDRQEGKRRCALRGNVARAQSVTIMPTTMFLTSTPRRPDDAAPSSSANAPELAAGRCGVGVRRAACLRR